MFQKKRSPIGFGSTVQSVGDSGSLTFRVQPRRDSIARAAGCNARLDRLLLEVVGVDLRHLHWPQRYADLVFNHQVRELRAIDEDHTLN